MALRGNLRDFSLPDVFQLVTLSGKTGVLRIRRSDSEGSVWFRDGAVFFAQSDWHHEVLGQRLVSAGKITPSALTKALDLQKAEPQDGRRLGQILVDEGYITGGVLEAFVQEQIQDTIFDLFRWDEGDFDFESLESAPEEDIGLSVSIENVVMEGSRRLEEWTRIKKKIPSMGIVFKMATAPGEGTFDISLKPTEWSLLLKVDGTRSVAELARDMGRTDFEVARIIYGLFSAGLLEVASDEEVAKLRSEREKLEASMAAAKPAAAATAVAEPAAASAAAAPPVPAAPAEVQPAPAATVAERVVEEPAFLSAPAAAEEEVEEAPVEAAAVDEPAFLSASGTDASAEDLGVLQEMMGAILEAPPVEEAAAPETAAAAEAEPQIVTAPPEPEIAAITEPEPEIALPEPEPEPVIVAPEPEIVAAEQPSQAVEPAEPQTKPASGVYVFAEEPPAPAVAAEQVEQPEAVPSEAPAATASEGDLAGLLETLETVSATPDYVDDGYMPTVAEPASVAAPKSESLQAEGGDFATNLMALGLGELPEPAAESESELTIAELEAAAHAADSEEATIAQIEEAARLAAESAPAVPSVSPGDAADLTELLSSLGAGEDMAVLDTSAAIDTVGAAGGGGAAAPSGVISTDAFLSDFGGSDVSFSSGMGDEITALTGGGTARQRPNVNVSKIPEAVPDGHVLHRDSHVDKALLMKIIEGVKQL